MINLFVSRHMFACYFFAALAIGLLLFLILAPHVHGASLSMDEQHQVAALFTRLEGLKKVLSGFARSLSFGGFAQTSSTQCSDGIDNDGDGQVDYPADTGCYSSADTTEVYDSTSSSSTWSSCSSSLTALLGSGCHQMYTDSSGAAIFCDGPMTMSAKEGDTVTTSGCSSSSSSSSSSSAPATSLNTVTNLSGTYRSGIDDIELSWTDNSIGEDEYKIWRSVNNGSWTYVGLKARPYTDGGTITYIDLNVAANTTPQTFQYMLKACTTSGSCAAYDSNVASVTAVIESAADTMPPSAPTGLGTIPSSTVKAEFYWAASSDNVGVTNYKIYKNSTYLTTVTTVLTYSDTAVSPATSYNYYVTAVDAAGNESTPSAVLAITTVSSSSTTGSCPSGYHYMSPSTYTPGATGSSGYCMYDNDLSICQPIGGGATYTCPGTTSTTATSTSTTAVPSAPIGLTAVQSGADAVITWNDNATNEDSYRIERKTAGSYVWTSWGSVGIVYGGQGTYRDYSVPSGGYDYRVKACNSTGCSAESNTAYLYISSSGGITATTTSSSCDSALTALLGTGCHYMYNDSVGNATYCDGPMTKSAKRGDTATTQGCQGTSSYVAPAGQQEQVWNSLGLRSWIRTDASQSRIDSLKTSCANVPSGANVWLPDSGSSASVDFGMPDSAKCARAAACTSTQYFDGTSCVTSGGYTYAGDANSCPGFAYSRWDSSGRRYCQLNTTSSCSYDYPAYLTQSNYSSSQCPTSATATSTVPVLDYLSPASGSCPSGYHVMSSDSYSASGYCMADNDSSSCQPLGGGAGYRCPSAPVTGSCDAALITLLGFGCHYMYNTSAGEPIYCDGNMTKSAKRGAIATTPGCQSTWVQPNAPFGVDAYNTYPREGERGVSQIIRIKVKFTREIDLASTAAQFFSLTPSSDTTTTLNGTFGFFGDSFEFTPASPLQANTSYTYKVLTTIKERGGSPLPAQFTASFTTSGGSVDTTGTLDGTVKDANGQAVVDAFVQVYKDDYSFKTSTASGADGIFRFILAPGTYIVDVYPPSNKKDLVRPGPKKVTINSGSKQTLSLQFGGSPKAVSGLVKFSSGDPVTDAEVGAYSPDSYQWISTFVDAKGAYTLRLGGGRWKIGVRPKNLATAKWSPVGTPQEAVFSKDNDPKVQIIDFTVPLFEATIIVKAVDESDKALGDVGIVVDGGSIGNRQEFVTNTPPQFKISDAAGTATFTLRTGRYYVRGYSASERGYLNPPEQEMTTSGTKKEIKLVFSKKTSVTSVSIRGSVKLEDGTPTDAFMWGWSERGGYVSTFSSTDGSFELKVGPNERWHVGAGRIVKNIPYKSSEVVVETKLASVGLEIILAKFSSEELPPPVVVRETATKQIVAQAEDGAKAIIPPQAAATSGNISVEIKPTVEAPSQAASQVVSTVYDVSIRNANGKSVTSLNSDIEIIIPYDEAELKAKGVKEEDIIPSFFDEKTGAWVKVDNFTIDKEKNIVISRVKHLTRFGIVAAADTVPPQAPSAPDAAVLSAGKIKVTWRNPASDFSYARVYRSDSAGELGKIVASQVKGQQYIDDVLTDGVTYYYTVRSVDSAANESNNKNQVSVKAVGAAPVPKPSEKAMPKGTAGKKGLTRNLSQGMRGDDVKILQELLVREGFLAPDSTTGFFGKLSKGALIKFQEKYAAEILKPVGLAKGNGFGGPGTRKKINELLK